VRRIWQNVVSIQYKIRSDVELVELARRGDPQAYDELVTRYRGRIYSLVLGIVGDHEEDATQALRDTFISAYRSLSTADTDDAPRTWLSRHAVRAALACVHTRHLRRHSEVTFAKESLAHDE